MKRAFVDMRGILLIMKITNRRLTHANSMICVSLFTSLAFHPLIFSPSVITQIDKVCLYFCFLIRTLLSQWELLLTDTQTLAGLYEFLLWWVWWDLRRCVWILPPADFTPLLLASRPETCGIKSLSEKRWERGFSWQARYWHAPVWCH